MILDSRHRGAGAVADIRLAAVGDRLLLPLRPQGLRGEDRPGLRAAADGCGSRHLAGLPGEVRLPLEAAGAAAVRARRQDGGRGARRGGPAGRLAYTRAAAPPGCSDPARRLRRARRQPGTRRTTSGGSPRAHGRGGRPPRALPSCPGTCWSRPGTRSVRRSPPAMPRRAGAAAFADRARSSRRESGPSRRPAATRRRASAAIERSSWDSSPRRASRSPAALSGRRGGSSPRARCARCSARARRWRAASRAARSRASVSARSDLLSSSCGDQEHAGDGQHGDANKGAEGELAPRHRGHRHVLGRRPQAEPGADLLEDTQASFPVASRSASSSSGRRKL